MSEENQKGEVTGRRSIRSYLLRAALLPGLALAGTLAVPGGADAVPIRLPPQAQCERPASEATCKEPLYRQWCNASKAACKTILQNGFQSAWNSSDESRDQYRNLDDENELVSGRMRLRKMNAANVFTPTATTYASLEAQAQAIAMASTASASPSRVRKEAYINNGPAVASCADYVYERYYDYMRFIDAANSCKNDDGCIVDMAYAREANTYPSPSNLADRFWRSRGGGNPLLPHIPLESAAVAKNGFYLGGFLLTPKVRAVLGAVYPGLQAQLDELVARMYGGSQYYEWANGRLNGPAPAVSFANEFDFHRVMREATRDIPLATSRANAARLKHFESLYAAFAAAAECHGVNGAVNCMDIPAAQRNSLLETIGGDPFIRTFVLGNDVLRHQAFDYGMRGVNATLNPVTGQFQALDKFEVGLPNVGSNLPGGGGFNLPGGGGFNLPGGGGFNLPGGTISTVIGGQGGVVMQSPVAPPQPLPGAGPVVVQPGGNGPIEPVPGAPLVLPTLPTSDPRSADIPPFARYLALDLESEWQRSAPQVDTSSAVPHLDCSVEVADGYRELACQATNALLDEMSRQNDGCLDEGYFGCDWQPGAFADRFYRNQKFMRERSRDYDLCMRWAPTFTTMPNASATGNHVSYTERILQNRQIFEDFPAERKIGANQRVTEFGESDTDYVTIGDKDTFGGGYSYLASWRSVPVRRKPSGEICRMSFAADANFKAWGTAFNYQQNIVDAAMNVRVNQNDKGAATFDRHLVVVDYALIPVDDALININTAPLIRNVGEEEDYTIFNATYWLPYGFNVEIDVGVELATGLSFMAQASAPGANTGACTGTSAMQAVAAITPYARGTLYGGASGGWAGIVSAGLRVELDLLKAKLPVKAIGQLHATSIPKLTFNLSAQLQLETLSGRVEACGCFLVFCGCQEVVSWPGIKTEPIDLIEPLNHTALLDVF